MLKGKGSENLDEFKAIVAAWHTTNRTTIYLIENLPNDLWPMNVPGYKQRTIRRVAAHIHNARCAWIKSIGEKHGARVPTPVDKNRVTRSGLARALERGGKGIVDLIKLGPHAAAASRRLPGKTFLLT
ncbi:MAG TPA: DinB family protein [Pyrinomonadaceae bacterium]|jgi:uncharacterized damage-inducible protein DinB